MIGDRLKKLRVEKGLSQKELAVSLGTSQGYISDIEKGIKKPGADNLISLKRFFGVDLDWLLTGEVKPTVAEHQQGYGRSDQVKDKINRILDELDSGRRKEILKYAEEKKQLSDLIAEHESRKSR